MINTFILFCFRIYLIEFILLSMIIIARMIVFTIFCALNRIELVYLLVCLSSLEEFEEVVTVLMSSCIELKIGTKFKLGKK